MVKIPTIRATGIKDGDTGPGVVCPSCQSPLPLGGYPGSLPEVFSAKCPRCGVTSKFAKSSIVTLTAHTKQ